jgi:hypothetical protein
MKMEKNALIKLAEEGYWSVGYAINQQEWDSIILLEIDEDSVFGYYQFMESPKQYFQRKINHTAAKVSRAYFQWNDTKFYLDNFRMISLKNQKKKIS